MKPGADRLRPAWSALPASLRTQIVGVIGGDFVGDEPAHGGFSASYAGVVTTTAGHAFVKACGADWHADSLHFLREEMRTLAHLPPSVAPRLRGAIDDAVGTALVIEAIDGRHPGRPWTTEDLHSVARSLRTLSTTPAPSAMPRAEDGMIPGFTRWREIAADPPLLEALPHGLSSRVRALLSMEDCFQDALHGDVIVHDDVRSDNILISDGRAHLLDWPHARRGAAWIDLPCLLPSVEASGGPSCEEAWAIFEEHGAPPQVALLPVISAFASFLWYQQAQPEISQLPGLREFQRAQADPALRWLATLI
ncbi:aminoglycoside phosphotransferase family protein [Microbacterium sp. SY138]|uniref:aminoglycoside phosphotransferase family protein n=1 Tax=Microbacterium sp. SY138 TaxID=3149040 RepID=UPI00321AD066